MEKLKKIDVAITDIKLYLKKAEQDILLLNREKRVLQERIDALEIIRDNEQYE